MKVGKHTYVIGTIDVRFADLGYNLTIGNFCSIAENLIVLLGGEHETNNISTFPFDIRMNLPAKVPSSFSKGDVTIGHDVWVGTGVTILSGVRIGNGAVIGAGSVVTHNIPAYEVWAGNPVKMIKRKMGWEHEAVLDKMAWWDWEDHIVWEASELLLSNDIEGLIKFWKVRVESK